MAQQFGARFNNIKIILVRPQMGENIGAVARVMLNFGLENLCLVAPRDGWPNSKAIAMSAGAEEVISKVKIYPDLLSAIADDNLIYAATVRSREVNKEVITPKNLTKEIINLPTNAKISIVIGPENSGLNNDDISYANKIITIPVNTKFGSINIAQATGIICYELFANQNNLSDKYDNIQELANANEINDFFEHLEGELDNNNYFKSLDKRKTMINNLRSLYKRVNNFSKQDVRTMRGIINCLAKD